MISVDATAFVILALVLALVFVLKNQFFEPLARTMEERETRIERAATAWGDAERTIEQARARVASAVQEARAEGYALLESERRAAQQKARTELEAGRTRASEQIEDARLRLESETDRAVRQLEHDADALARQIAGRILGREIA
ncbi:MAG TPA: hypothetical protein VEK15_13990 [Vicinamibacteria bacterium]|nr:hypothetical protein [Vicinamibacteria bacterium]